MAKFRPPLLALLALLLLVSQHVAVTHALWHQARDTHEHSAPAGNVSHSDDDEHGSRLCDFDAMLGQLLAGGATSCGTAVALPEGESAFAEGTRHFAALTSIQPRSRGPPHRL